MYVLQETSASVDVLCGNNLQVLIMFDALDEGDPPEQQLPGFKGGVMAGGNKALALVVRLLAAKLPINVRFIFTTRPDAACGGIHAILERSFPVATHFLRPEKLRMEAEATGDTVMGTGSSSAIGSDLASSSSGKVMVLETVLRECGLLQADAKKTLIMDSTIWQSWIKVCTYLSLTNR